MRRVRYCVAMSLDGYIAGPNGEADWIVIDDWREVVQSPREEDGKKDIWLFGGGSLFRNLAEADLVDTVEVAVIPTILGGGVPLIAEPAPRIKLELQAQDVYKETGTVDLVYSVERA